MTSSPFLADDPDDVRTHEPDEESAERPAGGHRGAQSLDGEVRPCAVDAPAPESPSRDGAGAMSLQTALCPTCDSSGRLYANPDTDGRYGPILKPCPDCRPQASRDYFLQRRPLTVPASASPQLQDVEGEGQGTVRRPVSIPAPSAITPMATSGEVGRRESRSAADPCEGLGSVVAQDGDSSACRPNTRPRARLIATEGL